MTVQEAASTAVNAVVYVASASFFIGLAAWNAGREQFHNYRRWPGL